MKTTAEKIADAGRTTYRSARAEGKTRRESLKIAAEVAAAEARRHGL